MLEPFGSLSNSLLLGVAVPCGLVALAIGLFLHARSNGRIGLLARQFDALRRSAAENKRYLPIDRAGVALDVDAPPYARGQGELVATGFRVLGDCAEQAPDGTAGGIVRWFVDANGTVVAWFAVVLDGSAGIGRPVMVLFSESLDGRFVTTMRGVPAFALALAPSCRELRLPAETPMPELLARHRAVAGGAGALLRRVETLADAQALHRRLRDCNRAWRAVQPADALLDADLESVLGERHRHLAGRLRTALSRTQ